ncbi:bifunctional diaminohydroxyphosphoribosylaminopyrimidine deaminase/5-amino-6-(5-phosphoribosylamino)uracil reductase RibD [Pedobacter sp. JCM 36344]|uniref:bifunctional diaminohydroxyphosphoribosylaminopyrimidine deaminase/5-amino-6-(5-phosphoribosylamino)uracil reductase RibD n=1 Tax=Pedobacter sp. JCM 36344 TaxID=3374280 RepID=UPI003978E9CE
MTDELYMQRCLEIAEMGIGNVSPNPMVGCVIVHEDTIIAEGYHRKFGEAHAEVNAVNAAFADYPEEAATLLRNSTVYVNLEPCAHFGKTPPCADLLVMIGVKKVVIGNTDPFSDVDGKGIEKLKAAGIQVIHGILEDKCTELNRRFFTRVIEQRPYIILKWAETANRYFAPKNVLQEWISGPLAKKLVHKWRTEEDAILIGKQTAICDNPQLTAREWEGKNPIRIVIDKNLQVPAGYNVFNNVSKTIVFNEAKTVIDQNIHNIQMEDMQYYLPQKIAYQLYLMDIHSVIIEGGANLLSQFIAAGLWDEARVFRSATSWDEGIQAPDIQGIITDQVNVGMDHLSVYKNSKQL